MRGNNPRRPTGSSPEAIYDQWVWDQLQLLNNFGNSSTVSVNRGARGFTWTAAAPGGGGTTVQLCVVTQLFGGAEDAAFDYIGVTPWDSTVTEENPFGSLSGAQVICAKCITGRGPASELIDGVLINYSQYLNDIQRYAEVPSSGYSEFQAMHTRYMEYPTDGMLPDGAQIEQYQVYICRTVNPTGVLDQKGNPISVLEIAPDRKWAFSPSLNGD